MHTDLIQSSFPEPVREDARARIRARVERSTRRRTVIRRTVAAATVGVATVTALALTSSLRTPSSIDRVATALQRVPSFSMKDYTLSSSGAKVVRSEVAYDQGKWWVQDDQGSPEIYDGTQSYRYDDRLKCFVRGSDSFAGQASKLALIYGSERPQDFTVTDDRTIQESGNSLRRLSLRNKQGKETTVYADPRSNLPLRIEYQDWARDPWAKEFRYTQPDPKLFLLPYRNNHHEPVVNIPYDPKGSRSEQLIKRDLLQAEEDLRLLRERYTDDREEIKQALKRVKLLREQVRQPQ